MVAIDGAYRSGPSTLIRREGPAVLAGRMRRGGPSEPADVGMTVDYELGDTLVDVILAEPHASFEMRGRDERSSS